MTTDKIDYAGILADIRSATKEPVKFDTPTIPDGVVPKESKLALDEQCSSDIAFANSAFGGGLLLDGMAWLGFSALAQMAQRAEYRSISNTRAKQMTRRFARLVSRGGGSAKAKRIADLEIEIKKYQLRKIFRMAALHDGLFGRGQVYTRFNDMGANDTEPLLRTNKTVKKGSLKGFKPIEPIWSYPAEYNSTDPLKDDYFVPEAWWVMSHRVHKSRLFTMVGQPVPDILKAAYAFCGISLTQLTMEYVNNWVRTRNSVGDLVHSFSLTILKTNMQTILQGKSGGQSDLKLRADMFNSLRDNRGLMLCDKDAEDVTQLNTTLATLDKLQAQAQEQQAAPSKTPLIFLLGITPTGLNASSDGEIRTFYDHINSDQEEIYTDPFQACLEILMLNKWGSIDEDITFEWVNLWQMDDEAKSRIRKSNADATNIYLTGGVVSAEEAREQLSLDTESGWNNLDLSKTPEPPEDDEDDNTPTNPTDKPEDNDKTSSEPASPAQAKADSR